MAADVARTALGSPSVSLDTSRSAARRVSCSGMLSASCKTPSSPAQAQRPSAPPTCLCNCQTVVVAVKCHGIWVQAQPTRHTGSPAWSFCHSDTAEGGVQQLPAQHEVPARLALYRAWRTVIKLGVLQLGLYHHHHAAAIGCQIVLLG